MPEAVEWFANEPFRMSQVSGIQYGSALLYGGGRETIVNRGRGKQAEPGMAVLVVVAGEKLPGKGACVRERSKAFRDTGSVFQRSEVAFRIGLSSETCGRLWVLVIPGSAIRLRPP